MIQVGPWDERLLGDGLDVASRNNGDNILLQMSNVLTAENRQRAVAKGRNT